MSKEGGLSPIDKLRRQAAIMAHKCKATKDSLSIMHLSIASTCSDEMEKNPDAPFGKEDIGDLAMIQADIRRAHDEIERLKKDLYKTHDLWQKVITPSRMDQLDTTYTKLRGLGTMKLTDDVYVSQNKEVDPDSEKLKEWLIDIGRDDAVKSTVNSSTLKSIVKDQLKSNAEIPDCIKVTPYSNAVITDQRE